MIERESGDESAGRDEVDPGSAPGNTSHETVLEVDDEGDEQRLDRFLRRHFRNLPHGLVHKLLRKRRVRLNGASARAETRLAKGDRVELRVDLSAWERTDADRMAAADRRRRAPEFRRRFVVIHEDERVVVLNKPPGAVVHPGPSHHAGNTLLDDLRTHLPELFSPSSSWRPAFVHRLDRGTSGVLVAAKTPIAAREIEQAMGRGETEKHYLALVRGSPRLERGELRGSIARREASGGPTRYEVVESEKDGARTARTRYEVVERFRHATLLEVEISTGRTHQIRVHLEAIGHPVAGDGDYGDRSFNRELRDRTGLRRLFLHAHRLTLPDGAGGRDTYRAPLAPDLTRVLKFLRDAGDGSHSHAASTAPRRT